MHTASSPGGTFPRGSSGYEAARRATMWNARVPDRFPDVIVQANDAADVVAAVRRARREKLRIGVRSGGHSWAGNHVRDGGMLLDVSRLREVTVDAAAMRATTGPGRAGHELLGLLGRHGLFFPAGHCRGVAVGGYLLQGGFGWNGRALGPACESVVGLDLVTAEGEQVFASEQENADLYWAARGAGPGFFSVVTRYHLRVHRKPRVIGMAMQSFPLSMVEPIFRWLHRIGPTLAKSVELNVLMTRKAFGVSGPGIEIVALTFADSLREAWAATSFLRENSLRSRASLRLPFLPVGTSVMYRAVGDHYPDEHRYGVDNMWTHAGIDDLLPGLENIARTLPPAPSHALWLNWAPPKMRGGRMAFSMEDDVYLGLYGVWKRPEDDGLYGNWATMRMREMAHLASGCQLADENLGQRPAKFVSDSHLARLDEIRAKRDPDGRFHAWMGRPS